MECQRHFEREKHPFRIIQERPSSRQNCRSPDFHNPGTEHDRRTRGDGERTRGSCTVRFAAVRKVRTSKDELPLMLGVDGFLSSSSLDLQETEVAFLADCGIQIIRDREMTNWKQLQPKPFVVNAEPIRKVLEIMEKYNLELMPVVGGMLWTDRGYRSGVPSSASIPDWVCAQSRVVQGPMDGFNQRGSMPILVPEKLWRNYVCSLAEIGKGKIRVYEIMNEPFSFFTAGQYREYLNAAHDELKKTDPAASFSVLV